jgi:8-oxo-dGTP pyrophosphatase MutT (NUDIX family)
MASDKLSPAEVELVAYPGARVRQQWRPEECVRQMTPASTVQAFPVSVKGVAVQNGRVLLLENERAEWELPGGKLEIGEDPPTCVIREIGEEAGWQVTAGPVLDCWQYHISEGRDVVIVTYGCYVASTAPPTVSSEHKRAALFSRTEIPHLNMPDGYKRSIMTWYGLLAADRDKGSP